VLVSFETSPKGEPLQFSNFEQARRHKDIMWTLVSFFFLLLGLLAVPVFASSGLYRSAPQQQSIYINCGGPYLYRDTAGNVWIGDNVTQYFNTGIAFRTTHDISGTDDQDIYATERWDHKKPVNMTYEIPIFDGSYDVFLHFAEIFTGANETDKRKFNVVLEGSLVLEEYDMAGLYGGFTAIIESFTTTVDDGFLTIDFTRGSKQNPKIAAIEIHPAVPSSTSPAPSLSSAPFSEPSSSSYSSNEPPYEPSTSSYPPNEPSSSPTLRPTIKEPTKPPTPPPTPLPTKKPTRAPTPPPTGQTLRPTPLLTPSPTTPLPKPSPTLRPTPLPTRSPITPPRLPSLTITPTPRPSYTPVVQTTKWIQVGQNISWMSNGTNPVDDNCISMSSDGQVIAIGQTQDDASDDFTGRVDMFEYNSFFGCSRFGGPIELVGDPMAANFGFSVSLNDDGTVIAVGDPGTSLDGSQGRAFVFEYVNEEWIQKGQIINPGGGVNELYAGRSVSISANGDTVAVMIQNKERTPDPPTFVRVYRYDNENSLWRPLGSDVYGRLASVNDAFSLHMCKAGTTFAISSLVPGSGYVETYKYNGTDWFLMGDAIEVKDDVNEAVGITVAMSGNGGTVAIGARVLQSSNLVRVYQFVNDNWTQVSEDIDSQGEINARRMTLAVSGDGKRVAVGPQDRTPFSKVFELKDDKWRQVAQDIPSYELSPSGFLLQAISLSGEGDRVAVIGPAGDYVAAYDEIMMEVV
jgi:hypothetical protein